MVFGPGSAKMWNVGRDADTEDFDLEAIARSMPTEQVLDVAILNPLEQYRTNAKRDAWHFAKTEDMCQAVGMMIVDVVKACRGAFRLYAAMALAHQDAFDSCEMHGDRARGWARRSI